VRQRARSTSRSSGPQRAAFTLLAAGVASTARDETAGGLLRRAAQARWCWGRCRGRRTARDAVAPASVAFQGALGGRPFGMFKWQPPSQATLKLLLTFSRSASNHQPAPDPPAPTPTTRPHRLTTQPTPATHFASPLAPTVAHHPRHHASVLPAAAPLFGAVVVPHARRLDLTLPAHTASQQQTRRRCGHLYI
jgi:hypothetical protein